MVYYVVYESYCIILAGPVENLITNTQEILRGISCRYCMIFCTCYVIVAGNAAYNCDKYFANSIMCLYE